jgi:hypothetical protein
MIDQTPSMRIRSLLKATMRETGEFVVIQVLLFGLNRAMYHPTPLREILRAYLFSR